MVPLPPPGAPKSITFANLAELLLILDYIDVVPIQFLIKQVYTKTWTLWFLLVTNNYLVILIQVWPTLRIAAIVNWSFEVNTTKISF